MLLPLPYLSAMGIYLDLLLGMYSLLWSGHQISQKSSGYLSDSHAVTAPVTHLALQVQILECGVHHWECLFYSSNLHSTWSAIMPLH